MARAEKMRAVEIGAFGLDGLRLAERAVPEPGPGRLLLRLRAVSLNYRDLLTVEGRYNPKQPLPLVPCSDGVGEVVETGPGVRRAQAGDRVIPLFAQGWIAGRPTREKLRSTLGGPLDGTLSEWMVVDEASVVHAPAHLSDEQAATLPCAGLTAWNALDGVRAGEVVLVEGTGGVSIFALQLARLLGARVIVTSSSEAKLARARELGAWQTLSYRAIPAWGREARRLSGGAGVDRVVEVGGAATLPQALDALAFGGRISLIGNLTGGSLELNLVPVFMRQIRLQGILVGHREGFEALNRAIEAHRLEPVVDRVFPLEAFRDAFEYLRDGKHFGKVCIRL